MPKTTDNEVKQFTLQEMAAMASEVREGNQEALRELAAIALTEGHALRPQATHTWQAVLLEVTRQK